MNVGAIDTRLADALRSELAGSSGVSLVEREDSFAHLIVRRGGDLIRVVGADGFTRHSEIDANEAGVAMLAAALRKEAAAKQLGDMENPAQGFAVSLELLGGRTSFGLGEDLNFRIESERDGYLTLVDLGTDGTVTVLLPNEDYASLPMRAGRALTYPEESGVYFVAQPPTGGGLVRAFVTAEPLDIEIPAGAPALTGGAELAGELTVSLTRAAGTLDGAVRLDSWGTASIVYDIHD